jgi:hypothetical protein
MPCYILPHCVLTMAQVHHPKETASHSMSASHSTTPSQKAIPDEQYQEIEDEDIELLSERVQRMEIDAFSYLGGLGLSSGGSLAKKVEQLKDEHPSSAEVPAPLSQKQPDFVSHVSSSRLVGSYQIISGSLRCTAGSIHGSQTSATHSQTSISFPP